MHTVVRTYSGKGAKELFDALEKHKADVEKLMRSVKGFVGYTLARSGDGGFSVPSARTRRVSTIAFKRRKIGLRRMPRVPVWQRLRCRKAPSLLI
jgi:hypothetical protein